jgi:hypothetical protein
MSEKVLRSGLAVRSLSWMALKPVMDDPSKFIPISSARSSSSGEMEKPFRCPSRSTNHSDTARTFSSRTRSLIS